MMTYTYHLSDVVSDKSGINCDGNPVGQRYPLASKVMRTRPTLGKCMPRMFEGEQR